MCATMPDNSSGGAARGRPDRAPRARKSSTGPADARSAARPSAGPGDADDCTRPRTASRSAGRGDACASLSAGCLFVVRGAAAEAEASRARGRAGGRQARHRCRRAAAWPGGRAAARRHDVEGSHDRCTRADRGLLHEAGETDHRVYRIVDGADDDLAW